MSGLDRALSTGLARWRAPRAAHDPAKVLLELAVTLALGGDCLAGIAVLRAESGVYGAVASDPTVSRTIDALAADAHQGRWRRSTLPGPAREQRSGSSPERMPPIMR